MESSSDHVIPLEVTRLKLFIALSLDYDITLNYLTLSGLSNECHTIKSSDNKPDMFFAQITAHLTVWVLKNSEA